MVLERLKMSLSVTVPQRILINCKVILVVLLFFVFVIAVGCRF